MTDTAPEIAEMVRARLMALTGAERFRMGAQMFDAARRMALASLPAGLSETEHKRLLFERLYGEPLPTASLWVTTARSLTIAAGGSAAG